MPVLSFSEDEIESSEIDFNFLKEIHTQDEDLLNKNKLKIYKNVLLGYRFAQKDMNEYYDKYEKLSIEKKPNEDMRTLLLNCKIQKLYYK